MGYLTQSNLNIKWVKWIRYLKPKFDPIIKQVKWVDPFSLNPNLFMTDRTQVGLAGWVIFCQPYSNTFMHAFIYTCLISKFPAYKFMHSCMHKQGYGLDYMGELFSCT